MRAVALSLLALTAAGSSSQLSAREQFEQFKTAYGRLYASDEEEAFRFSNFEAFLVKVAEENADEGNTAIHGITKFADRTSDEIRGNYGVRRNSSYLTMGLGGKQVPAWDGTCYACERFPELKNATIPAAFDWTEKGAITPVKDQKQCGGCFTFSCAANVEASWFLSGHPLISLSEQQLVSCDREGPKGVEDEGCKGSISEAYTFRYVVKNKGLALESTYPYQAKNSACEGNLAKKVAATIDGYYQVSGGQVLDDDEGVGAQKLPEDEEAMVKALVHGGPFTIAINSEHMDSYKKGVDNPSKCPSGANKLDHQVLIVGYGEDSGEKYWRIKNSWNTDWGEKGYYRIKRGTNLCGVADDVMGAYTKPTGPPAPTPTPPSPTPPPSPGPAPSQHECQPSRGCNVCKDCCGDFIFDGLPCDECVKERCK